MNLHSLLQRADLWRGGDHSLRDRGRCNAVSSGLEALDAQLPGGGWPRGALTELLFAQSGIGELRVLMPALAHLTRTQHWLAWVAPPYLPYAPALAAAGVDLSRVLLIRPRIAKDGLWAMEQALRSGVCGAVLGWFQDLEIAQLRRLQLAAEAGGTMGALFREPEASKQPSPAALRLQLAPSPDGTVLHILKRRGGWSTQPIVIHPQYASRRSCNTMSVNLRFDS